jgi:hypothetical protein
MYTARRQAIGSSGYGCVAGDLEGVVVKVRRMVIYDDLLGFLITILYRFGFVRHLIFN